MRTSGNSIAICLAFCCGAIAALFFWDNPVPFGLLLCGALMAAVLSIFLPHSRWFLALIAGILWVNFAVKTSLESQLDPHLAGSEVLIDGRILSIPNHKLGNVEFRFQVDKSILGVPAKLRLRWYQDAPALKANELWRLKIRILPPRGRLNFTGFDFEKWLFARRIGAIGTVRSGELLRRADQPKNHVLGLRQSLSEKIDQSLGSHASRGLIKALAIGDRSGISKEQWSVMSATGTTHLLAISGMHIGMIALFGFWAGKSLWRFAPFTLTSIGSQGIGIVTAVAFASVYALLSGFVVPAQRALILILIVLSGALCRRKSGAFNSLTLALAGVIVLNPLAPLRIGFWLSFSAVAVLLYAMSGRQAHPSRFKQLLKAQWVVILGMTPLTLYFFQQTSLAGIPANLLAIPLISTVIVPLTLTSVVLIHPLPSVAGFLLWVAAELLSGLELFLAGLASLPGIVKQIPAPGILATLAGVVGVLMLLAPRTVPVRLCGLIFVLPLVFTKPAVPSAGSMELTVLDVGQGSAVLLRTANHLLLYDTGPGDGGDRQLVDSTIEPAIRNSGFDRPDKIIVSHADLDHAGGLSRLLDFYHSSYWHISLPRPVAGIYGVDCRTPLAWHWDGFDFVVHHPGPGLPYLGNDSSCVLGIRGAEVNVLLPGDISESVEQRLLQQQLLADLRILLVPHHGSASSSSQEFINAVNPEVALISSGYLNRFSLPKPAVVRRYRSAGSRVLSTAECGAIRVTIDAPGNMSTLSARHERAAIWRQKAAVGCQ